MKPFFARSIVLLLMLGALPSAADTDYVCLKACTGNGENYMKCTSKCSYDTPSSSSAVRPKMEYKCLKQCVDAGGAPNVCVPQCTQAPDAGSSSSASATKGNKTKSTAHNPLEAPAPSSDLVLPSRYTGAAASNMDFACRKLCMQGGLQYELCRQRCAK